MIMLWADSIFTTKRWERERSPQPWNKWRSKQQGVCSKEEEVGGKADATVTRSYVKYWSMLASYSLFRFAGVFTLVFLPRGSAIWGLVLHNTRSDDSYHLQLSSVGLRG